MYQYTKKGYLFIDHDDEDIAKLREECECGRMMPDINKPTRGGETVYIVIEQEHEVFEDGTGISWDSQRPATEEEVASGEAEESWLEPEWQCECGQVHYYDDMWEY